MTPGGLQAPQARRAGDRYLALAPLAALGALDGLERLAFEAHARTCLACRGACRAYEQVAARLPLALAPRPPDPALRERVLARVRAATVR